MPSVKKAMKEMKAIKPMKGGPVVKAMKATTVAKTKDHFAIPKKLVQWDMVLHCTGPGCPSWIFHRKIGTHNNCQVCGRPWIQSYMDGGSMLWQQLATTKKKAKETAIKAMKSKKDAMKKGQAMKTTKMKAK